MRMGEGIVVIRHEQNYGQGRALRTGLAPASSQRRLMFSGERI
jgi:hypothetical protein